MLGEKITLLNEAILACLDQTDEIKIAQILAEASIRVMEADFGFVWLKSREDQNFQLVYKSPTLPYNPKLPREHGKNNEVIKSSIPYFVSQVEKREDDYDVSQFMKSFVIVPIDYEKKVYGNIVICFKETREFLSDDKSLCVFIGNAAAQALTIHRLVQSEQEARVVAESLEARFRSLIENSYDIISLIAADGRVLYMSPSATRVSGYEIHELVGRNIAEFVHKDYLPELGEHMQKTLLQPETVHRIEFRYRHKDGSWRWMEATGVNMLDNPSVRSIVANIRDITETKQAQETILHQALHDPLTGLPNRTEFVIRLEQVIESAKRHKRMFALMFLDMDRFKNINDTLGHAVGDTLLKVVATRFKSCLRAEDTVARFGGDEFLILLNEISSSQDAAIAAEKFLKAVSIPVKIGEHTFHPSVSIGIAVYPHDGLDTESLKKRADIALYRAKASGRNCYSLYDRLTDTYALEKFSMENELRQAITLNQIVLYYQPIVSLKTGKVLSVEALARWQHPGKGLLLPGDFIPLAEETGLILNLSQYILKTACRQYQAWKLLGLSKFRVAVNLSAQSFAENNFIPELAAAFAEYEMEPDCLEIEITESAAMGNLELAAFNLKQLKKMGIHITIDDFGTGYSSLAYLKRFPVHNLKIDRTFVRNCITNQQDAGIVRTIISMAHNLNLKVVAEGIETDQQLNFLKSMGCNLAQGFYISHPLPAQQLVAWLEEKIPNKKVPAI